MKIPIGVSARHLHISKEDLETLFGTGYELTHVKDLSQPGQFACEEKISLESEAGRKIDNIRILGPVRPETQVEISRSDAIRAKINAPVKASGDLTNSPGAKLIGPKGEVTLSRGVIVANRHIHFSPDDAKNFGVEDKQIVSIKVEGEKGGIMHNVSCRVNAAFALDMHIDTDDACAFELSNKSMVELIK